ncbi:hypothetical protein DEU53_10448 [Pantoea sp. AG1095]|nr:hypothetical protein DEU53_10448 [Pantoea sp. AG1095]
MIHVSAEEVIALHDYLLSVMPVLQECPIPEEQKLLLPALLIVNITKGFRIFLSLQQPIGWQSHAGIFLPMRIREPRLT